MPSPPPPLRGRLVLLRRTVNQIDLGRNRRAATIASMASRPRVTIGDVARSAGVSPTTVSHALNGKGVVRPATRARVLRTAQRLGYLPNSAARNLRSGRTATLGMMFPREQFSGVEYYLQLASAAAQAAFARDHGVL